MSYQVIARKYRPQGFDSVLGQESVARTLKNAIAAGRVAHAYMFCGPRGVGKTSMARILARALNCLSSPGPTAEPCGTCDLCVRAAAGEDLDVLEIDAASNRKVDDARALIAGVSFHPTRARFKVYVVDEVHMLTTEAFNALLKTLEEPPPHVKFVFATTDPQKVPATILSRCQRFDFRPIPERDIVISLRRIAAEEGLAADEEALAAIARAASGGMRDAQSLLEQLGTLGGGAVRVDDLHALLGTVSADRMRRLFDALAAGDARAALAEASEILDAGTDPAELLRQCLRHAHDLMVAKAQGPRADAAGPRAAIDAQAKSFSDATLVHAVSLFGEALKSSRLLGEARLFAETALARLAGHRDMRFLDQMVRDLQALERRLGGAPGAGSPSREPAAPASPAGEIAPRAEPAPAAGASQPAAATLEDVRARWPDVLEGARAQGARLRTALAAATVEALRDGALVLGFSRADAFHRGVVSESDARDALEALLDRVLGRRLRVETAEREAPAASDDKDDQAVRRTRDQGERLTAAERAAAEEAPITRLLEKELKARIVHVERDAGESGPPGRSRELAEPGRPD